MIAEIISIGDELASGERLDTNSQWLSQRLGELGVKVVYHTTVADDLPANLDVFRRALQRADLVVTTGGLGPTADDLTRDALAAVLGVELVLDSAALEHIRSLFARHNRPMPERNRLQALFPAGSRKIDNPAGTAPGIDLLFPRPGQTDSRLFALPGVPAEMREMWAGSVAPAVAAMLPEPRVIRHRRIKCFGAGESQVEQMLPDLIRRGREPSVGITVHEATITLRITAAGPTAAACQAAIAPTEETIREALGVLVFGTEDDELEDVVVRLLGEQRRTVASIEWGTRGRLARWLARAAGEDACFAGGVTIASVAAAERILAAAGPAPPAGGAEFAERLAIGCRRVFQTDYALAAGPFPHVDPTAGAPIAPSDPLEKKPGASESTSGASGPAEFHFALASAEGTTVRSSTLAHHPAIWEPRAAKQALNLLRLALVRQS
ncbi:MAG TPA: CinA family nicotinamide mononucleotide deamidase-related protein [Pirellulales bacterium]|nr:CinA family nicotinamide mononucleotide deamidase-related protein [Pirellulales bacterium]